jgi:tetratricopeptide (TPR) repeat protein
MRFRLIGCTALIFFASSPLLAQIGQISGQARFAEGGQPAFNAIVSCDSYISGFIGQQYADRNGRFQFSSLQLGQYTIRVRLPGYTEEKQDVDLSTAITANLQFRLKAEPNAKPASRGGLISPGVPAAAQKEFDQATAALATGKKENVEEAIRHLEKAVALYPEFVEAELKLGAAYMDLQQWDKAEQALKRVLEIDPKAANAYFALGEVYLRKKNYDQAERVLQEGLAIETHSAQAHLTLARVYWDSVASAKEEARWRPLLEKSYEEVKQALALDPNLAAAHLLKGNLLFKVHRAEDALHEFEEYLRLDPKGAFAADTTLLIQKIKQALAQNDKK